jgi:hypothetical protein
MTAAKNKPAPRAPGDDESGQNEPVMQTPTAPIGKPTVETTYVILREDLHAGEPTGAWLSAEEITVPGRNVPSNRLKAIEQHVGIGVDALVGRWRAVVASEWHADVLEIDPPVIPEPVPVAVRRVVAG